MAQSAGSSFQATCGRAFPTPIPLQHTPVRQTSSQDPTFCPDFVCRIRENMQKARGVRGEEQSMWGGSDGKAEAGRRSLIPLLVLFRQNPPTSCVLLPTTLDPFAYSP